MSFQDSVSIEGHGFGVDFMRLRSPLLCHSLLARGLNQSFGRGLSQVSVRMETDRTLAYAYKSRNWFRFLLICE